jgi:hypothetical protein
MCIFYVFLFLSLTVFDVDFSMDGMDTGDVHYKSNVLANLQAAVANFQHTCNDLLPPVTSVSTPNVKLSNPQFHKLGVKKKNITLVFIRS